MVKVQESYTKSYNDKEIKDQEVHPDVSNRLTPP